MNIDPYLDLSEWLQMGTIRDRLDLELVEINPEGRKPSDHQSPIGGSICYCNFAH